MIIELAAGAVLGLPARRIAGGLLKPWKAYVGGTLPKIIYATLIGLAAFIGHAPWWLALGLGVGVFAGHVLGLHGSDSMGRYGPGNWLFSWGLFGRHWLGMSAYGVACLVVGAGIRLWLGGWHVVDGVVGLGIAALATPAIYAVAWLVQDHRPGRVPFNSDPPELAEWFVGLAYGTAASLVMT